MQDRHIIICILWIKKISGPERDTEAAIVGSTWQDQDLRAF